MLTYEQLDELIGFSTIKLLKLTGPVKDIEYYIRTKELDSLISKYDVLEYKYIQGGSRRLPMNILDKRMNKLQEDCIKISGYDIYTIRELNVLTSVCRQFLWNLKRFQ